MKIFTYAVSIAFVLMFAISGSWAQALEPIGGPYTVDANTVLLLHFDGNLTNAAATVGKTAASAVGHSTNLATKLSYIPNSVTGMGQCVRLDNSSINDSTYITVDDTASLDLTGNWTIEAWANIFTFGSGSSDYRWVPRIVMKTGDNIFWYPNYWMEMWGDSRTFQTGFHTPDDQWISTSSPPNMFVPGEWVHLTFIRDTARAFIAVMVHDATLKLRGFITRGFDKSNVPMPTKQKLHIGWAGAVGISEASVDSWLDGFVDEVRVSNVVRNFAGPPVIQDVTVLPNQPTTAANYPVSVTVFPLNAGGSITSAVLKYRPDTTGTFSSVTMTSSGTNKFTGNIPAQTFGKIVQYYVVCTDNNSLKSLSPVDAEATVPSYYKFGVYQANVKVLDLTFEEGPTGLPVDHSTNKTKIVRHTVLDYSTQVPAGGGVYSLELKQHTVGGIDSNWVEADSPFLAVEEFTLDTWIKADSADLHATRIIINPTAELDWNNANFELSFRNGGSAGKAVITGRYWDALLNAVVLQDTSNVASVAHVGKWRHIILERSGITKKFAMDVRDENDVRIARLIKDAPNAPKMAAAPLRIGRSHFDVTNNWYVAPYRGKIDNVKVYNYAATGITGVGNQTQAPLEFSLAQNYPNPFNPTTEIEFVLPKYQQVSLVVYDLLGRKVKTLVNDARHAGEHRVTWNGTNELGTSVASGVYVYRLASGSMSKVHKMMLLR